MPPLYLNELQAESLDWQPLGQGTYLHVCAPDEDACVITVTGVPDAGMAAMNVLLC